MTIHERFAALPRARKGSTRVVIVEESVLAELIADAQATEGDLARQSPGPQPARRRRPLMRAWILRLLLLPRPPRCGDDECVDNHG